MGISPGYNALLASAEYKKVSEFMPKARSLADHFWEKVDRRSPDGCWN